jgi:uncharacterized membrane protein
VLVWKFLHVAAMFLAVAVFVGQGMLSARIVGTGDVHTIRRLIAAEARFQPIGGGMLLLGLIFGFITATSAGFDLTAPWLLISYGLVVIIILTGATYHGPRERKLKELAEASPEDRPSEELSALIAAPSARVVAAVDGLAWLAVVFVMVVKPFSEAAPQAEPFCSPNPVVSRVIR